MTSTNARGEKPVNHHSSLDQCQPNIQLEKTGLNDSLMNGTLNASTL